MTNPGDLIRATRVEQRWSRELVARKLEAAGLRTGIGGATARSFVRQLERWEKGATVGIANQRLLAIVFECGPEALGFPPEPHLIGATLLEDLRATKARLVALDSQYGGDNVVGMAVDAWRAASNQLATTGVKDTVERDVLAALGDLASVGAWAAYDAERPDTARRMAMEALHASRAAGDDSMVLFELDALAMQSVRLDRAGEASRLTDQVVAAKRLTSRLRAICHIRRAGAASVAGQRGEALAEIGRARALFADGVGSMDPPWAWWIDESEIWWHEGMALMRLDDPAGAVDRFGRARECWPVAARRSRWGTLAHLLDAQTAAGAWAEAEETMAPMVPECTGYSSARVARVLSRSARRVRDRDGHGPSSTLVDAAGEILTLLAG